MEQLSRIQEINETLNSFLHSSFPILVLIVLILSIPVISSMKEDETLTKRVLIGYIVYIAVSVAILYNIGSTNGELKKEAMELEEAYFDSLEQTVTIETSDIVKSTPVRYKYCPQEDLYYNDTTYCHLVEFVTDGKVSQVLIPLKKSPYASAENKIRITYYDITDEEREFFNEKLKISEGVYSERTRNIVDEDGWALGKSIDK